MIKLSPFDTMFLPLTPMQRLFFYEGDDLPPFPDLVRALRSSLAATLAVFTPLAGQVAVSPSGVGVAIDCSPGTVSRGGVRFVEAEYAGSAADVRRLAGAAEHEVTRRTRRSRGPRAARAAAAAGSGPWWSGCP